jgi:protein ImuB
MSVEVSRLFGCVVAPAAQFSAQLIRLSQDFTPRFEVEKGSLALLDLSGLSHLFSSPRELASSIQTSAVGYGIEHPRIALATRLQAARRLALFRPGLSIALDEKAEAELLGALPLESLDLDDRTLDRLRNWGLHHSRDLAKLPASDLRARGGALLVRAHESSSGRDERLLVPMEEKPNDGLGLDPGFGVEDLSQLVFLMFRLLDPLCAKLKSSGRAATAFEVTLALEDGAADVRLIRSPSPSADHTAWRTLVRLNLEGRPPAAPVLSLSLRAESTSARAIQFSFTGAGRSSPERVASALARLQRFFPEDRIGSPELVDTHTPDQFLLRPFDPVSSSKSGAQPPRRGKKKATSPNGNPLPPPEARSPASALRAIRPPAHANVRVDMAGAPVFLLVQDHDRFLNVRGRVQASAGPYLLSTQWWNEETFAREEWDVEITTEDGTAAYLIFRDPRNDTWYLAAEID